MYLLLILEVLGVKKFFKMISVCLAFILLASLCSCSKNTSQKKLLAVMNNENVFINENGEEIYINKFEYTEGCFAKAVEYTFVDFDSEGVDELVVKISNNSTVYLVLRDSGEMVYGYLFHGKWLQAIKESGSFMQTGGANVNYYCHLSFDKNRYSVTYEAICDEVADKYELYGESCSVEKMQEYTKEWSLLPNVTWEQVS